MMITALIIVIAIIALIWTAIELKRFKHKIFAIFLVALIILAYVSFAIVFKDQKINWKDPADLKVAGGLYLSWLGAIGGNLKLITSHAIQMDWNPDNDSNSDGKTKDKEK